MGDSAKMGPIGPATYTVKTEWDADSSKWVAVVWTRNGSVDDSAIATHQHRMNAIQNAFVMLAHQPEPR